jgi:hypothetical protein
MGRPEESKMYMTVEWRRELLLEWWGAKRIIRLAHRHGLYEKAAKTRTRLRQIEGLFAKERT